MWSLSDTCCLHYNLESLATFRINCVYRLKLRFTGVAFSHIGLVYFQQKRTAIV